MDSLFSDLVQDVTVEDLKPIIKWPGGKRRLLNELERNYPKELLSGKIDTFIEPFFGGGALTFHIMNTVPTVKKYVINDRNPDVVGLYQSVRDTPHEMLRVADRLNERYHSGDYKSAYYEIRAEFNEEREKKEPNHPVRSAYMLFVSKTCFNSLYRVSRQGKFNQSCGDYRKNSYDHENIYRISEKLKDSIILQGDYLQTLEHVTPLTFMYCDPPYRHLEGLSGDRLYSEEDFNDNEQERLQEQCEKVWRETGAKILISNSDPTNTNPNDLYFDELYSKWNIERVSIRRSVSRNKECRGEVRELLIRNYDIK